jgi:hypothetical protein
LFATEEAKKREDRKTRGNSKGKKQKENKNGSE